MMKKYTFMTGAAIAVLLLAACGSSGGLGDILGGGTNSGNGAYATQIRGTVDSVDTSGRSIYLINVTGNGSMLSSGGSGQSVRVYFDNRTTVNYNGQSFRPEDLERGDQVDVTVNQSSNQLYANSMNVVYNARAGNSSYPSGTYPNSGTYGTTVHGTVRAVDTYRGTITVDRGYNGGTVSIPFSTNTPVYYNGQTYRTSDLQVGDEIDVRMNGSNASDITVTRSINSSNGTYNNGGTSSQYATIRGTVRSVNTSNHTIQLDSPSWMTNFNRGSGTMSNTITVSYDPNMSINANGQSYPISGLERGDVIDVQVQNNGNSTSYWAQSISLVRDVRQ
jgi:hypothetical protein